MSVKSVLANNIGEENFDGLITIRNDKTQVVWWRKGEAEVNTFWTELKISKTIVFSCKNGNLVIF